MGSVGGGRAGTCSLGRPEDRPRGLRRQATAATAQPLRTTAALTNRRSAPTATRRPMTIAALQALAVLMSLHSGRLATRRPTTIAALQALAVLMSLHSGRMATRRTTTIADLRSRALTIRRPHARIRRLNLIPHPPPATPLLPI